MYDIQRSDILYKTNMFQVYNTVVDVERNRQSKNMISRKLSEHKITNNITDTVLILNFTCYKNKLIENLQMSNNKKVK